MVTKETRLSNLVQRILFAIPAAFFFIWMTWLGGWYFQGMIIVIGFFIIHEINRILDNSLTPTDLLFPYTIGLWVMLSHTLPNPFEIGIGILVLFLAIQTFNQSQDSHLKLTTTLFAGLYAPLGLLCFVLINKMGSNTDGFIFSIMLMLMVWGSDVFAYFGGKTFGKHSLAPEISPNKTWEGFFFGYLGSLIGAVLVYYLVPLPMPFDFPQIIPMTLLVATFGPIGDLLESKMKRKAKMKDSSSILPGHGGFFDRFDALLLAAPVAYVYLTILDIIGFISI
jgi:phosphatidate cytidylyltransferase